jgi:putative ABC transport system permease protein
VLLKGNFELKNFPSFLKRLGRASLEKIKAKLATVPRKHAEATLQRTMNISFDDYIKSGKNWELFLQPITAIH